MPIVDRRHSVSEGTAIKAPCRAATTANITLAGEQTIDGIACVADDRVLVKSQTDGTQNGIYAVSTGNWTRTRDFDGAFDIVKGTVVRVTNGSVGVGYWEVTTSNPIVIDTTSIAFALTTNSISGVSSFVQTLLDDTTAAAFLATLGVTLIPVGTVHAFAGSTAPTGFLLCYGQAVSRTTYAALFAVIGATYGAGDGSTTFNLPDLRGRAIAGKDNMGGTSANRLTGLTGGLDGDVLGATGGAETHTLTAAELPANIPNSAVSSSTTTVNSPPANPTIGNGSINVASGGLSAPNGTVNPSFTTTTTTTVTINASGGGALNIVQPTLVFSYIIKT